ncbi:MAG: hypothetical protein MUF63_05090, partial [Rhodobacteraceae bacterium]|nr:hypothetical protein [Paracoccaceae bacterium]
MFDSLPATSRNDLLDEARCLFFDHGHDLSDAACLMPWSRSRRWNCSLLYCEPWSEWCSNASALPRR